MLQHDPLWGRGSRCACPSWTMSHLCHHFGLATYSKAPSFHWRLSRVCAEPLSFGGSSCAFPVGACLSSDAPIRDDCGTTGGREVLLALPLPWRFQGMYGLPGFNFGIEVLSAGCQYPDRAPSEVLSHRLMRVPRMTSVEGGTLSIRDTPGLWSVWGAEAIDSFCRSFGVIQLLALLHLMLVAVPLKRERPRANRLVCRCRSLTRGAPLTFAVALCLPFAEAAPHRAFARGLAPSLPASTVFELDEADGELSRAYAMAGLHRTEFLPPEQGYDPGSPVFSRVRAQGWEVPVVIFVLQGRDLHTSVHTACMRDADDVVEAAEDNCDARQQGLRFFAVQPQPCLAFPALLAAPVQHASLHRVPICLQLHSPPDQVEVPRIWVEFVDEHLRLSDVEALLANEWRPGSRVYVANSRQLLTEAGVPVSSGDLVRIACPGYSLPSVVTLQAKLVHPSEHLCRLSVDGFPAEPAFQRRHGLFQPLESARLVQYAGQRGSDLLGQVLLSHAAPWISPLRLLWPRQQLQDVYVRSRPACAVAMAFPHSVTHYVPVLVDSRKVCFPIQVKATTMGTMTLDAFLDGIGMILPDTANLVISGSVAFDKTTRAITVAPADVVTLRYSNELDCPDDALQATDTATLVPDARTLESPATSVTHRSDTTERERTPRSAISGAMATNQHSFSPQTMQDLWRIMGRNAVLVDPASAALRRVHAIARYLPCSAESASRPPLVYQDGEWLPPQFSVPRPEPPPPADPESPAEDVDVAESDTHSYLPDLLRLRVAVMAWQRPTVYGSLWYEEGECIDSLLVRANLLLQEDSSFTVIVAADPQPCEDHLTLIVLPLWWRDVGICPLLLQPPLPEQPAFLQVAFPGETAASVVPAKVIPDGLRCALLAPASSRQEAFHLEVDSVPATVLSEASFICLHESAAPPVVVRTPQAHLATLQHLPPDEHLEPAPQQEPRLAVLLGFDFDFFFVNLVAGSVKACVARALGLPTDSVYVKRQWPTFDMLVVAGRRPAHCFGFRNLSDHDRDVTGTNVFIDPRPMGRSVCFRELLRDSVHARELCTNPSVLAMRDSRDTLRACSYVTVPQ